MKSLCWIIDEGRRRSRQFWVAFNQSRNVPRWFETGFSD